MGSVVAEAAEARGWAVTERFNTNRPLSDSAELTGPNRPDAVIDFSAGSLLDDHVRRCTDWGVPLVSGTTGFGGRFEDVRAYVEAHRGSVLYSPNFSIGIAVLRRALATSLALTRNLDGFDVAIQEVHHTAKRDRPSGTAILLAQDVRQARSAGIGSNGTAAGPDVSSLRVGTVVGEHTVRIDGPDDQIVLHHSARSRRGFATGALEAAAWIQGRTGFFTMDDMLDEWARQSGPIAPGNTQNKK